MGQSLLEETRTEGPWAGVKLGPGPKPLLSEAVTRELVPRPVGHSQPAGPS